MTQILPNTEVDMSKAIISEQHLSNIADAIRTKTGYDETFTPAEMSAAINQIVVSGESVLPNQTGNAGKFLTTDGTTASWGEVPLDDIQASLDGKLDKSGGPMSGDVIFSSGCLKRVNNTAGIMVSGGINQTWDTIDGSQILLNGGARDSYPGCFLLRAGTDPNNRYQLIGQPNGELTWGGVSILPMIQETVSGTSPSISVKAGKAYVLSGAITALKITGLPGSSNYQESSIWFTAGTSAPTITFSSGISYKVIGKLSPEASKSYVMSIMANTVILAERG